MGRKAGSEGKGFVTRVYPAYPNRTQERELLRQLDVARGVYNHFAETCILCLIDGSHVPDPVEMNREFTEMRADDCLLRSVNSKGNRWRTGSSTSHASRPRRGSAPSVSTPIRRRSGTAAYS